MTIPRSKTASTRLPELDGLRGLFLVLMTLAHLELAASFLQKLHPSQVSVVDAASGFVLLSGIVAGLVYGSMARREGMRATATRVHRRAATLAIVAAGLVAVLMLAALLAPQAGEAWTAMLGPLVSPSPGQALAGLLLIQHVDYGDILPQYVVYLLLAPVVIGLTLRGRERFVIAASAVVWLATQFGAAAPLINGLERLLASLGPGLTPPHIFNLLGWQLLFVAGCVLGAITVRDGSNQWRSRARLDDRRLLWLVLSLLSAIAVLRLLQHFEQLPPAWVKALEVTSEKSRLGPLALFNVAAVTWLMAWACSVASRSAHFHTRWVGVSIRYVLTAPPLRLLGRHSLVVYVYHVLMIYVVAAVVRQPDVFAEPWRSLLVVALLGSLSLPALAREWLKRLPRRSRNRVGGGQIGRSGPEPSPRLRLGADVARADEG